MTSKELMGEIIAKLNKEGYKGGFYHYSEGECSCCYGPKDVDFYVNENIPENWGVYGTPSFYYKISYNFGDKDTATKFRKSANKLARKYFGKMAETARSNFYAIIININ
jgi:hypothetical protein